MTAEYKKMVIQSCFSMLEGKIDSNILKAVLKMGFSKPSRIQFETLPYLLIDRNVIACAQTGSGKTLAFLIPVIQNLIRHGFTKKRKDIGSIILSPTRELALQTYEVLKILLVNIELSHCLLVGGERKDKDRAVIEKGVNIIVSTPGRLLDHMCNIPNFNCTHVKSLILDEADKLLDGGFEQYIKNIARRLPKSRQTALFSATIDENVEKLAKAVQTSDPVIIRVKNETQSTVDGLQQGVSSNMFWSYSDETPCNLILPLSESGVDLRYYICPIENKMPWLFKMLKKGKDMKMMVFFSSCLSVDFHYKFFKTHCKVHIMAIHGRKSQAKRKKAFQEFLNASSGVLFCTDVAARGLDIQNIDWVVQYDPPTDYKEYIHRVGRTARGENNTGNAVLLLTPQEEEFVQYLQKENVHLDKYSFSTPSEDIQRKLECVVATNGIMKTLARKAFHAFLKCYQRNQPRKIFNLNKLDLQSTARAFGFREMPDVDFVSNKKKKDKEILQTECDIDEDDTEES